MRSLASAMPTKTLAMDRGAVHQHMILAVRRHHDLVNTEKAAHGFHPALVRRIGAKIDEV
jgi:hypothetical protein